MVENKHITSSTNGSVHNKSKGEQKKVLFFHYLIENHMLSQPARFGFYSFKM